ncbi:BofC C-terminal domain-containing protein [Bacillus sp. J37]|uniref:BofC C-terminal domain-containing protein n=1 Tax=Bacillus sp. J37 TaxID=935837 RepID=UPI00047CBC9E|nr:BofC C-terminal domain-containing protein [Bacillus sp. J37]
MRMSYHSHILTVCSFVVFLLSSFVSIDTTMPVMAEENSIQHPLSVKVVLQRKYLDGEISEEIILEKATSIGEIVEKYSDWILLDHKKESVVFQSKVDDISPLLKTNGYFGITGDGIFSIFNGRPGSNDIIQSFFQLDVEKLESHKHDELMEGIRIESKDQYLEVLKIYETYSKIEKK